MGSTGRKTVSELVKRERRRESPTSTVSSSSCVAERSHLCCSLKTVETSLCCGSWNTFAPSFFFFFSLDHHLRVTMSRRGCRAYLLVRAFTDRLTEQRHRTTTTKSEATALYARTLSYKKETSKTSLFLDLIYIFRTLSPRGPNVTRFKFLVLVTWRCMYRWSSSGLLFI